MDVRRLCWPRLLALTGALACAPPVPAERRLDEPREALRPPGERGAVPEDARRTDYVIDATLDAEQHKVSGTVRITWRNHTSAPVPDLALHLYMNAFRAEDTAWMLESRGNHRNSRQHREEGRWGFLDVTAARLLGQGPPASLQAPEGRAAAPTALTWAEGADPSLASVALPRPVAPGEAVTVELEFVTQLPRVFARTGYDDQFHMVAQWYPKLGVRHDGRWQAHVFTLFSEFYADFGDYDVRLDVPEDMVVGASGIRVEERPPEAGRRKLAYKATMVHDFAWAASPDFLVFDDLWRDVRIRQLIPRALAADAPTHLEALVATLESMDRRFGPYPWSTITVIHPPDTAAGAQGMEYPTLFTTSDILRMPLPLRLAGVHERVSGEFTTIHEFGHQYFQGLLASDEFTRPWLDEGLNSYSNILVLNDWLGEDGAMATLGNQRVSVLDFARTAVQLDPGLDPVDTPSDGFREFTGTYGSIVYRKTAALLLTLRNITGHERFDRAFRAYVDGFRFRHPTGDDLVDTLARELGPKVRLSGTGPDGQPVDLDVRDFLAQGLRATSVIDFAVTELDNRQTIGAAGWHRDAAGQLALTDAADRTEGDDKSPRDGFALVVRRGEFRTPVDVEAEFEDGGRERVVWDGQERYRLFTWPGRRLTTVTLDPDEKLVLETRRLDNILSRTRRDDGVSAPVAHLVESTHLAVLAGVGL